MDTRHQICAAEPAEPVLRGDERGLGDVGEADCVPAPIESAQERDLATTEWAVAVEEDFEGHALVRRHAPSPRRATSMRWPLLRAFVAR